MGTYYDHLNQVTDPKISEIQMNFLCTLMVVFHLKENDYQLWQYRAP